MYLVLFILAMVASNVLGVFIGMSLEATKQSNKKSKK